MIDIKKELIKTVRNSIRLTIGGAAEEMLGGTDAAMSTTESQTGGLRPKAGGGTDAAMPATESQTGGLRPKAGGGTRFGGKPDVPDGFEWPYFEGESYEGVKNRPLSFIAQFDLEEISRYDTENLLPKTGVMSFFYELNSMAWGYDPEDKGCARVYWFEDASALRTADFPEDLEECFRLPALKITAASEKSYQSGVDFMLQREDAMTERWDEFDEIQERLGVDEDGEISKLLGWANPIQGNMTTECELVSRGYYLGDGWDDVTPLDRQEAEQWSAQDWLPLFQLDMVEDGDFELMFGDGGRIYYYIRRDDLAARKFDDVWLIMQCC